VIHNFGSSAHVRIEQTPPCTGYNLTYNVQLHEQLIVHVNFNAQRTT